MFRKIRARHLMASLALTLAGCGTTTNDPGKPDASNSCLTVMCGTTCCAAGQTCNALTSQCQTVCIPDCVTKGKQCGDDGCGSSCGSCSAPSVCDSTGKCCQKETDLAMCQRLGKECGSLTALDNCGQQRTIAECGPCDGGKTCSATGTCNSCTPDCVNNNKICGDDGCGDSCGDCPASQTCSATGRACVACTPNCGSKVCGTDANGCSCGICPSGSSCNAAGQCTQCTPQSDASFCSDKHVVCGSASGTDNCGATRTVNNCGTCQGSQQCVNGQCITCNAETDTQLCANALRQCGAFETTDSCGAHRSIVTCGSCGGSQRCSANGTCVTAVTCGTQTCAPGQGCYNPTTGASSGTGRKCTCLPKNFDPNGVGTQNADTCATEGMVCSMDRTAPAASTCRLPQEFEECETGAGCDVGLQCYSSTATEWPYNGMFMCLRPCSSTSQCADVMTSCKSSACRLNICAAPDHPPTGSNPTVERAKYFQNCVTGDGSGGTCLPWRFTDDYENPTAYVDRGFCAQNGTLASGSTCDPYTERPNTSLMCPANEYCQGIYIDTSNTVHGICRGVCDAKSTSTTSCGASGFCLDFNWDTADDQFDSMVERAGICMTKCNVLTSSTACNVTDALGDSQGCMPDFVKYSDGSGYCRPTKPGAASAGGGCFPTSDDIRNTCTGNLVCDNNYTCVGWCNTGTCPSQTSACSSCRPTGSVCFPIDTGYTLGLCQ